jgi:hypothetical protein
LPAGVYWINDAMGRSSKFIKEWFSSPWVGDVGGSNSTTHLNKKGADLCAFFIVVLFDYIVNDFLSLF